MKLRKFLADNHEVLKGKVMDWDFGRVKYQLQVLSSVKVQYKSRQLSWTKTNIDGLRADFEIVSFTVGKRSICRGLTLHLVTTG